MANPWDSKRGSGPLDSVLTFCEEVNFMYDKDSEDSCHEVSPYLPALQDALQAQLQSQKVRSNPHIPAALPCSINVLLI